MPAQSINPMEDSPKAFGCIFCERNFNRPDALKRHWQTCRVRLNACIEVPRLSEKRRGKKPRACDRCARLRRACSSTYPCLACARRHSECTYSRTKRICRVKETEQQQQQGNFSLFASDDRLLAEPTSQDAFVATDALEDTLQLDQVAFTRATWRQTPAQNMTYAGQEVDQLVDLDTLSARSLPYQDVAGGLLFPKPTDLNLEALKTFPFLRNLASVWGLSNVFECGNMSQRSAIACDAPSAISFNCEDMDLTQCIPSWQNSGFGNLSAGDRVSSVSPQLVSKSDEIFVTLARGTTCDQFTCKQNKICNDVSEKATRAFFSPENLRRYLALYWSFWHPNWPVMHKASFSIASALPSLVAAMAVIGACLSTLQEDRDLAKTVFDVLEDTIFNNEAFASDQLLDLEEDPTMKSLKTLLDILLAAYCVCLYQTWEGGKIAKRRVRRQRYNQVMCLARDIGPESATLKSVSTDCFAAFDWDEFALRESLARTFAYINNLDTGLAMFYQVPLRMHISELDFDLSTPETCFAAESAEDCFAALKSWRDTFWPQRNISLSCAVTMICSESQIGTVERMISRLSVLSMFTLISTLYKLAHQLENSPLCTVLSPAVKHGLDHWRRLWPSEYRDFELLDMTMAPNGLWFQRIGFQRYAPEYWLYAYLTMERAHNRSWLDQGTEWSDIKHDDTDMERFNVLLLEFANMNVAAA